MDLLLHHHCPPYRHGTKNDKRLTWFYGAHVTLWHTLFPPFWVLTTPPGIKPPEVGEVEVELAPVSPPLLIVVELQHAFPRKPVRSKCLSYRCRNFE